MTFWSLSKKPTMTRTGTSTRTNFSQNSATNDFKLFILFHPLFSLTDRRETVQKKERKSPATIDLKRK